MADKNGADLSNQNLKFQQGAHIWGLMVIATLCFYMLPKEGHTLVTMYNMLYVIAFALSLGIQFWMTFVNGLTLIKILPRFWFGEVQSKLFRKYFTIVFVSNCLMLGVRLSQQKDYTIMSYIDTLELIGTVFTIGSSLINLLYLTPESYKVMTQMYKLEKEAGYGEVIGRLSPDLMKDNKHYGVIRKSFFTLHGIAAILNLVTLMCGLLPAFTIASRMQ